MNYGSNGNQVVIIESMDRTSKKRKAVSNIFTWIQAYSILMAAPTSDKSTTNDQCVGLVTHLRTILQMAKELSTMYASIKM